MKHMRWTAILALLTWLLAACSGGDGTEPGTRFVPYPEESQLLGLTNAFRGQNQQCGTQTFFAAPPLTWVEAVGDTAWFHSVEMGRAATENHVGASTLERLKSRGYDPGAVAEMRKRTPRPPKPEDAFNAWKADPALCALLMSRSFTAMGAGMSGHYETQKTPEAYWTQILTTPKTTDPPRLILNIDRINTNVGSGPAPFTAILVNATDAVNWTLSGPGSISSGSGPAVVYTPPASGAGGTATLTARAGSLNSSATINVQGAAATLTLTLTPATVTVRPGGTGVSLTAKLTGATSDTPFQWEMTGPGTLIRFLPTTGGPFDTANADYEPPSQEVGTAVITVRAAGLTATATITVDTCEPSLCVTPKTVGTGVNAGPTTFTATTTATGPITWSLRPGCGSLSANTGPSVSYIPPQTIGGVFVCPTEILTATVGGTSVSATIQLSNVYPQPSVSLNPSTATATVGGSSVNFTAAFTNIYTFPLTWSLNGPGSLTSSGNAATYTPPASGSPGTATITARATDTFTGRFIEATATVTLNAATQPPTGGFQQEMLVLVNQLRSQSRTCGTNTLPSAPPLTLNAALNTAAQLHSQDMATNNYFSHTGLNGSQYWDRAAAAGYTGFALGENIAAGKATAQATFNQWVNSPPHCATLMNASATQMGIGYASNPSSTYTHYWTFMNGRP